MYDRALLRAELARDEGYRRTPYRDSEGVLTVGFGHNLESNGLPERMLWELFDVDIDEAAALLDGIWAEWRVLDPVRQRVLVNMAFNLGARISGFRKMWAALALRDFTEAAHQMLDSRWARQVGIRAERLAETMTTGR